MLRVDMIDLEMAFESRDHLFAYYLDTESGRFVVVPGYAYDGEVTEEMEEDIELVESAPAGRLISLDSEDIDLRPSLDDAREFARSVEDQALRKQLENALSQRRGAFRLFNNVVYQEAGESERWEHFRRQRLQASIAAHLASRGVHVQYEPLPPYQPRFAARAHLLAGAAGFVDRVKRLQGIERIAVIGSITTPKREPNGIDLLVTVTARDVIPQVAAAARKLQGQIQQINRGAAVFLADPANTYLGRTCPWRECSPGIRASCHAQHCGGHLYDDLHVIKLGREVIESPPLEIWPKVVVRQDMPADVREAFGIDR